MNCKTVTANLVGRKDLFVGRRVEREEAMRPLRPADLGESDLADHDIVAAGHQQEREGHDASGHRVSLPPCPGAVCSPSVRFGGQAGSTDAHRPTRRPNAASTNSEP